jgi:Virulence factor
MARYRILSWRDIPAQVKVFDEGRRPLSVTLSERWQQEIDRVAMRDGLVGTDDYLSQWEWSQDAERDGSAEDVLDALVTELEASWETRRPES